MASTSQAPSECPSSSVAPSPPPDIPVTLQSLLELNLAYQDLVQGLINELETILMENRVLQDEADEILATQVHNNKMPCRAFRLPYFFDSEERLPPPSEEKIMKDRLGVRNLPVSKKWISKELVRLEDAVYTSLKGIVVSRLLAKKGRLEERLAKCSTHELQNEIANVAAQLEEIEQMRKIDLLRRYRNTERIDWLRLSVIDFDGRRSDRDLELTWENLVWPSINCAPWDSATLTKMDEMIKVSPNHPDWEKIAEVCGKHVTQCWEVYLGQRNSAVAVMSDYDLKYLYAEVRTRDYVPWLVIGKKLNTFSPVRVIRRVEAALCRNRRKWRLEDDVLLLLSIYLYRGCCDWSQIVRCMNTKLTARSAGQVSSRIEYLLGNSSLQAAVARMKASPCVRLPVPVRRCKETMVRWLLSLLMSVMTKVRMSCFYKDDCVSELQRISLKVAKNVATLIASNKRVIAVSDRLDNEILRLIEPQPPQPKPVRFPGADIIFPLMEAVIEKHILKMASEPNVCGSSVAFVEKRKEAVVELERGIESGLLLPSTSALATAQVLLDNLNIDEEPLDPTVVSWAEEQIEKDPAFAEFEKHFNALFAFPMLMSSIDLPDVKPMIDFDQNRMKQTKKRKEIMFRRKRSSKKPWIKARWEKLRLEKAKDIVGENEQNLKDEEEDDSEMQAGTSSSV